MILLLSFLLNDSLVLYLGSAGVKGWGLSYYFYCLLCGMGGILGPLAPYFLENGFDYLYYS